MFWSLVKPSINFFYDTGNISEAKTKNKREKRPIIAALRKNDRGGQKRDQFWLKISSEIKEINESVISFCVRLKLSPKQSDKSSIIKLLIGCRIECNANRSYHLSR